MSVFLFLEFPNVLTEERLRWFVNFLNIIALKLALMDTGKINGGIVSYKNQFTHFRSNLPMVL